MAADLDPKIAEFEQLVAEHFTFLKTDFGFRRGRFVRQSLDDPRESVTRVRYAGPRANVYVSWGIGNFSVGLTIESKEKPSAAGRRRGGREKEPVTHIDFEHAVEYLTGGKVPTTLPYSTPSTPQGQFSARQRLRHGLIRNSMGEVLRLMADKLKRHGADFLNGDRSRYEEIGRDFEEKFYPPTPPVIFPGWFEEDS